MINVEISRSAVQQFEGSAHSENHQDEEAIESLIENFRSVQGTSSEAPLRVELTRREAKALFTALEAIEQDLAGEQAVLWERDSGEKTGEDYERQDEIERMLDPIRDAFDAVRRGLYEPLQMLVNIDGRSFELEASVESDYPDIAWKSTISEFMPNPKTHPPTGDLTVRRELRGHASAESAIREAMTVALDEAIGSGYGPP